jgi:hypothetical protein
MHQLSFCDALLGAVQQQNGRITREKAGKKATDKKSLVVDIYK